MTNFAFILIAVLVALQWKQPLTEALDSQNHNAPQHSRAACDNFAIKADPADCTKYLMCINGNWESGSTCPEGAYFDAKRLFCAHGTCTNDSVQVPTTTPTKDQIKCKRLGMAADLSDCNKFYYCDTVDGNVEHRACAAGRIFEPRTFSCIVGLCI